MPCFHELNTADFTPIGPRERAFIAAVVSRAPDVLSPVLTQLDEATTHDDGTGWLVFRDTRGEPCEWPEGHPFDIVPSDRVEIGPQGCYCIMLWFHGDGQLQAAEFLMLEKNAPLQLEALTAWLLKMAP